MEVKESYHIFKTNDGTYLVAKIMECNEIITHKIIAECETLELAEDAVPANSIAVGDNIQGFSPIFLKRKKRREMLLRRFAPMLRMNRK